MVSSAIDSSSRSRKHGQRVAHVDAAEQLVRACSTPMPLASGPMTTVSAMIASTPKPRHRRDQVGPLRPGQIDDDDGEAEQRRSATTGARPRIVVWSKAIMPAPNADPGRLAGPTPAGCRAPAPWIGRATRPGKMPKTMRQRDQRRQRQHLDPVMSVRWWPRPLQEVGQRRRTRRAGTSTAGSRAEDHRQGGDGGRQRADSEGADEDEELAHEAGQAGQAEAGEHEEAEDGGVDRRPRRPGRPSWRWSGRASARR